MTIILWGVGCLQWRRVAQVHPSLALSLIGHDVCLHYALPDCLSVHISRKCLMCMGIMLGCHVSCLSAWSPTHYARGCEGHGGVHSSVYTHSYTDQVFSKLSTGAVFHLKCDTIKCKLICTVLVIYLIRIIFLYYLTGLTLWI